MTETMLPADLAIDLRQLVMTIANTVDLVGVETEADAIARVETRKRKAMEANNVR